jgi:hypothetical protein
VIFFLASGTGAAPERGPDRSLLLAGIGTVAATVTAEAIRDAVRSSQP